MDFNSSIDIIIKDLREAREIIDDFRNYPGVPRLQIELAKSKCKSAEEVIALLKSAGIEQENERKDSKKVQETQVYPEETKDTPEPLIELINPEAVPESEERIHDKRVEKIHEPGIVADRFTDSPDRLNERLGHNRQEDDISSVLKSKPVQNLSDAIGVNDKFLFIREIFAGNQSAYSDAIDKLNNTGNISDAKAIVMSYSGVGEENEAVKLLLDIVKRKLPFNG